MSCWTDCCTALTCSATACLVVSSLDELLQANPSPPKARRPRRTIAGKCQVEPLFVSTYLTSEMSDIVNLFSSPLMGSNSSLRREQRKSDCLCHCCKEKCKRTTAERPAP